MPRANSDGIYRTTPRVTSPPAETAASGRPEPRPSRATARAEPPAQASESGNAFGVFNEAQMDVLAAILGETQGIAEKQLRDAIKALREEKEIEVGLVREELMGRMDAKLFGSTLIDDAGEIAKKAVQELRRDLDKRVESLSTGLDDIRARLDRTEREAQRRELDTWRGLTSQLGRNFARVKDLESKASALAAQLDVVGTELRQLRHDLGDEAAKPWAPLALPAPA
jgi:hypothetical protein